MTFAYYVHKNWHGFDDPPPSGWSSRTVNCVGLTTTAVLIALIFRLGEMMNPEFDNLPEAGQIEWHIAEWLNAIDVGDPRAEALLLQHGEEILAKITPPTPRSLHDSSTDSLARSIESVRIERSFRIRKLAGQTKFVPAPGPAQRRSTDYSPYIDMTITYEPQPLLTENAQRLLHAMQTRGLR